MVLSRSCSRAALATVTGAVLLLASPAVPGRAAATKPADKPTDAATEAKLDRPLPEVDFKGHALSDVIDFLRDVTRATSRSTGRASRPSGSGRTRP